MMLNKDNQIDFYKHIVNSIEGSIYWKDLNGVYVGCNNYSAKMVGLANPDDIVGKTDFDLFPVEIAEQYQKYDNYVINYKTEISVEEQGISVDGEILYQLSSKKPLYDATGNLIGIIGNTINITDRKKLEELKLENQQLRISNTINQRQVKVQGLLKECLAVMQNTMQVTQRKLNMSSEQLDKINRKIDNKIQLTKREKEILYYLAMSKSPKEIATILGERESKNIAYTTILSIIDKQLYPKFGVFSISQLIEKATLLNLLPFLLDDFVPPVVAKTAKAIDC